MVDSFNGDSSGEAEKVAREALAEREAKVKQLKLDIKNYRESRNALLELGSLTEAEREAVEGLEREIARLKNELDSYNI